MDFDFGGPASSVASITQHPKYGDDKKQSSEQELFQGLKNKLPPMPGELSQLAKNHWVCIGTQLESAGLITQIDLSIFRRYCEAYAGYVSNQRQCDEKTEFQSTPNGYQQFAPWKVARDRYSEELSKLENKLFLNPMARKSIKLENPNQMGLDLD